MNNILFLGIIFPLSKISQLKLLGIVEASVIFFVVVKGWDLIVKAEL